MKTVLKAAIFGLSATIASGSALAFDAKVGVIQGLSGPPAIVDFGESYLQGIRMALKEYKGGFGRLFKQLGPAAGHGQLAAVQARRRLRDGSEAHGVRLFMQEGGRDPA